MSNPKPTIRRIQRDLTPGEQARLERARAETESQRDAILGIGRQ
jgi:hypothetical protein